MWGDSGGPDGGVGMARMSERNAFGGRAAENGDEWALTVEAIDSAAGVEVSQAIPRVR